MIDPRESGEPDVWRELEGPGAESVAVAGVEVRAGSRVRLRPRAGADIFDRALEGQTARVESIEEDLEGQIQLAVTVDDDPGRDLGERRFPGHRFFFTPEEVEPLAAGEPAARRKRVLVAGIGNIFMGDDGFGVELAGILSRRELPPGVEVIDFGIRGMDLAYALQREWDAVVFLDATPRGQEPGTLYVIEPEIPFDEAALDTHGMDPVKVLQLAHALGAPSHRTLVVGCEPMTRMTGDEPDVVAELTEPVALALDGAVRLVEGLLADLMQSDGEERES